MHRRSIGGMLQGFPTGKQPGEEWSLIDDLVSYLKRRGIHAALMDGTVDKPFISWRKSGSLGCISVGGQSFDAIKVTEHYLPEGGLHWYELHFIIEAPTKGHEKRLEARTQLKKEGIIHRKVVDFRWVGKQLADNLNQDIGLKEKLLPMLQNKVQYMDVEIEVRAESKKGFVRITKKPFDGGLPIRDIDVFNKISTHICYMV